MRNINLNILFKMFLVLVLSSFAGSVFANFTSVNCTGNPSDRALIQSAINNAHSNDTLKLIGTCQMDGTQIFINKSNLTFTGAGVNGGWSTVVKGVANTNGKPAGDKPDGTLFNRAFKIGDISGNAIVRNILIQNIKFSTIHRSVLVNAQIGGNSHICISVPIGAGFASNVVVQDNWFDNTDRAAEVFGNANNIILANNRSTNGTANGGDFRIQGQSVGCDGAPGALTIGVPKNITIIGNSISDDASFSPIFLVGSDKVIVANNVLSNAAVTFAGNMIQLTELSNSLILNNQINATGAAYTGIFATDWGSAVPGFPTHSSNNLIIGNKISNAPAGVAVDTNTTGYAVIGAKISNSAYKDIFLCGAIAHDPFFICDGSPDPTATGSTLASFNNLVIALPNTTVLDEGTNNIVIGGNN